MVNHQIYVYPSTINNIDIHIFSSYIISNYKGIVDEVKRSRGQDVKRSTN